MHATSTHSTPFAVRGTAQTFFRTVGEILLHPRRFFAAQFAPERSATDVAALRPLPPFEHLAIGIGLATLATPLHQALLRLGGFPGQLIDLANSSPADMIGTARRMVGHAVTLVDLGALTGIPMIDVPIEDAARTATYFLLAALFWLFSGSRLPVRSVMAYFAYVFGAMLVLDVVANLLGDLLFLALPGDWQSRTFTAGLVGDAASLVRVAYIVVFPALIFPALLGVPRATVIGATMLACLSWGLGGLVLTQLMIGSGLVVLGPGL
jgi:hypothetical protein